MEDIKVPENLPTRGGSGMPPNRGGEVVPIGRTARKKADKDEDIKRKQEAAVEQARKQFLKSKPTREEVSQDLTKLFEGLVAIDRRGSDMGLRVEAMVQALRRMNSEFEFIFGDSMQRMIKWREKVRALETGSFALREIVDQIKEWNADPLNPPIRAHNFTPGKLEMKAISDLDLNKEEKIEALEDLGFPQPIIDEVITQIQAKLEEGSRGPVGLSEPESPIELPA